MAVKLGTRAATVSGRIPDELVASSVFLLKRLGTAAKQKAVEAYEEAGLSPYHHGILALLDEGGVRETQGAIADALGYDRGTLVGLLDELEAERFVERRRDPVDRRRHIVRLTPEGKRALERLRRVARRVEDDFLGGLADEERAALHALLLRLASIHEPRCAGPAGPPA